MDKETLYKEIKNAAYSVMPGIRLIVYGSYARNEEKKYSDVDIIAIVNAEQLTHEERKKIRYAIYDVELKYGLIMSPTVLTNNEWEERKNTTPFYENVAAEGVEI